MAVMMKSDQEIQRDVLAELNWDPGVDATEVGVEVDDGVVTLTGTVDSFWKKIAAEHAAKRVNGVRAVANDVVVKTAGMRTDTDIAKSVAEAIERNILIPKNHIKPTVKSGWVTLEGKVAWRFERDEAEDTVRRVAGVLGVTNLISMETPPEPVRESDVKSNIEGALVRSAELDATGIKVEVRGGHVTLKGTVHSLLEKSEAETAAWRARGVTEVTNKLEVRPR